MILLLVGHISSGKSTYCKLKAKEGCVIINDDAIVNAIHGQNYTLYNKSLKPLYKSIENHIFCMSVAMGKSVVIDRGLDISKSSRKRWIALARSLDVNISAVVFDNFSPEVHARRRFEADNRGHDYNFWLNVAKTHADVYDPVTCEEGFDQILLEHWKE